MLLLFFLVANIQTDKWLKRMLFIRTETQSANVQGNPLYQATKQHLTVKQ